MIEIVFPDDGLERLAFLTAAKHLFLQCLQQRKSVLGELHPSTLATMNNLGIVYVKLGDLETAESFHSDCLNKREIAFGEHHPFTSKSRKHLARVYSKQGRKEKGKKLYSNHVVNK